MKRLITTVAVSAGFVLGAGAAPAEAMHLSTACSTKGPVHAKIATAITQQTGVTPTGYACDPSHYAGGNPGSTQEQVAASVSSTLASCNSGQTDNKLLTLAVLTQSTQRPVGGVCSRSAYEYLYDYKFNTSGSVEHIDWTKFGEIDTRDEVFGVTNLMLNQCTNTQVSQAVLQVQGGRAINEWSEMAPPAKPNIAPQGIGQCHKGLYNHGQWNSYGELLRLVGERASSTQSCNDPWITAIYQELTNWKPLPSECAPSRYGGSIWSDRTMLKNMIFSSWRCNDPWVGQIYLLQQNREARGWGSTGECNEVLYIDDGNTGLPEVRYFGTAEQVESIQDTLGDAGATLRADGDLNFSTGVEVPGSSVLIKNPDAPTITNGGGSSVAGNLADLVQRTSPILTEQGAGVKIAPGAELISDKGLGIIGQAGGNFGGMPSGGAPVISTGGGNF